MSTGVKVAIGCAVAAVLAGVVALVAIGAGAFWLKGKVEETTGDLVKRSEELDAWQRKANANPFTRPADDVVAEARLVKFIEVRRGVHEVYQANRAAFEGALDEKDASLSDIMKAGGMILEARTALLQGLAEAGMSEAEYAFLVEQVYRSAWASATEEETGRTAEQAAADAARQAQDQVEDAIAQLEKEGVSSADLEQARDAAAQLGREAERGQALARTPPANVELFRKYEADLKKYAMEGLALAGL